MGKPKDMQEFVSAFEAAQALMEMTPEMLMECPIRAHGNGFIQVDIQGPGGAGTMRLHVWDRSLELGQQVSTPIHDHRFDFESVVLVGSLSNMEYQMVEDPRGDYLHWVAVPRDGEDTELIPEERKIRYSLGRRKVLTVPANYGYEFSRYRFHESVSTEPVTVTVMVKTGADQDHRPRVAVPTHMKPDNEFNRYQYPPGMLLGSVLNAVQLIHGVKPAPLKVTFQC